MSLDSKNAKATFAVLRCLYRCTHDPYHANHDTNWLSTSQVVRATQIRMCDAYPALRWLRMRRYVEAIGEGGIPLDDRGAVEAARAALGKELEHRYRLTDEGTIFFEEWRDILQN